MMAKNDNVNIDKLTFEEAISGLTDIVDGIEHGRTPLQESLDQYEKGMALIKHCRSILQEAEKRIAKITQEQEQEEEA